MEWTEEQFAHIRKGVVQLAQRELKNKELNQVQLTALFHLLAYGEPVTYKENDTEKDYFGYGGAGWFIENHF